MNNLLVVNGCTLKFKTPTNSGIILITSIIGLSLKAKAEGKQIYKSITFTVTGATNGTVTGATGAGTIQGNANKVKCDNLSVVLDNAESPLLTFTGVIGSTPATFQDNIIIDNAGQTKTRGL